MQGMNYLTVIRLEIACLAVLLYIAVNFLSVYRLQTRGHRLFLALLSASAVNIVFDMITVYTVNRLDTVDPRLNVFLHVIFIGSLTTVLYIIYLYIRRLVFRNQVRPFRPLSLVPLILSVGSVILLPLEYTKTPYGNYSSGPAAMVAYVCVAVYFLLSVYLLVRYRKNIDRRPALGIATSLACMIAVMLAQAVRGEILITSLGIALVNLGFFFTLENADTLLAEQLAREKERADNASRSKSVFLADMSREIRTPLNAMLGMNEMILRETKEQDTLKYASGIDREGKNLLTIINDILDFSKIESGRMEIAEAPYRLSAVLHDVSTVTMFRAKEKNLGFDVSADRMIPDHLSGDEMRVRQVLMNLLTNAVKYTHKGSVSLNVGMESLSEDQVSLVITVKDTGIGIREEDIQRLFSTFDRMDPEQNKTIEGTGLGLAITKNLTEMMNGEIRVESTRGEGSVFTVILPQRVGDGYDRDTVKMCLTAEAVQGAPERDPDDVSAEEALRFATEKTPELLSSLQDLLKALQPFFEKEEEAEKKAALPPLPQQKLKEFYTSVREFARSYDQDGIRFLLEQVKAYSLPEDENERVRRIAEYVRKSDWGKISELADDRYTENETAIPGEKT